MKPRTALLLAALILLGAACLPAQVKLSDTPAAHQLSSWLAAFNSGDKMTFQMFLQKNYPARTGDIDQEMDFRERTGGFDLKKAGECDAIKCAAILQERGSEQFARMTEAEFAALAIAEGHPA